MSELLQETSGIREQIVSSIIEMKDIRGEVQRIMSLSPKGANDPDRRSKNALIRQELQNLGNPQISYLAIRKGNRLAMKEFQLRLLGGKVTNLYELFFILDIVSDSFMHNSGSEHIKICWHITDLLISKVNTFSKEDIVRVFLHYKGSTIDSDTNLFRDMLRGHPDSQFIINEAKLDISF